MAEVIYMPKLSDTMTEGVVAEWLKKVGDEVSSGEILAEIESDKATMEFESFYDGVLLHIGVEKGKAAPVDSILAIIGEKGEDVSSILEAEKSKAADSKKDEPKEEPKADGGTRKSYKSDNESIASFLMWELRNKDRYLRNWIEEIFADMYGCVIAGPVIALDFQDLQMDDRLEEFADATIDHEDPPPLIRPDTYSKVLAKSTDFQRSRLAELLHHRWKLYRNTLWNNYRSIYLIDQPDDIEPILKIGRNAPNRTAGNRNVAASIQNQPNTANSENIVRVSDIREDNLSLSDSSFDAMITIIWKKFIFNVWEEVKGSKSECHDLLYLAGDIADQEGEEVFLSKLLAGKTIQDFPNDEEKRNELDTELNKLYENFKTALNVMIAKIILKEATPSGIAASDEERNNKWVAWQNRWEKRNVLKRPSPNVGLLGSNPKPLTGDDVAESRRPETEWGWVILAYANGWVTRGPEPNPTGD